MKKTYLSPTANTVKVRFTHHLLDASNTGVVSGASVGDEYEKDDVSYGRRSAGLWDDDED